MNNFPEKPKEKRGIYMDHAATTYIEPDIKKAMDLYFSDLFANPAGLYGLAQEINGVLNDSRRSIAKILGALSDNIIFTGSGTSSDNLAIFGTAYQHQEIGKHIITTKIEHKAVLEPCRRLEAQGFEITYLDVNEYGQIDIKKLKQAIRPDTILVSIMYANNEIGTVEPIAEIGKEILKIRKENNSNFPYFHTDACQATGSLDLNVEKLHVDLMTINGSKMYGPKGIGVLYKRRGLVIQPMVLGGGQEMGLNSGTENIPNIVGIAKALELAQANKTVENKRLIELRDYFWQEVKNKISNVRLNGSELGDESIRLPNNLNISILGIEGESALLYLDSYGIACSTGSACNSKSLEASHVHVACGLKHEEAHGSLRFTLGHRNTKEDIDYVMKYLPGIVEKLREISPIKI
ncbi:cysteine desulfurase [Patescibacteria group bacterium]|nr:cysteine desulfurase [Patescibacteria group bacterium]MBU1895566.1 cysteine desulfurase [Patescibacteria group bacterium]